MKIVVLAALPQEVGPLKRAMGPWRLVDRRPCKVLACSLADREVILAETGMGTTAVHRGLERVSSAHSPELIVSMGFGGSLFRESRVGDVLLGRELALWPSGDAGRVQVDLPDALPRFCREHGVGMARVVTVERPESKKVLSRQWGAEPTLMDMESYHVARWARDRGVPFLCLRAVSDALDHEIDYDLGSIANADGKVQIHKVLAAVVRKPGLVASFYASWRRSSLAARRLAVVLAALLNLPRESLLVTPLGR